MEILVKIIGIAIITTLAVLIIKQVKPEMAIMVGLAGSIVIVIIVVNLLGSVVNVFDDIVSKTGINQELFLVVLKIIGVGYLTEFSANLCADAGVNSMADKIMLAGKVIIMIMALPIINNLLEIVYGLMV